MNRLLSRRAIVSVGAFTFGLTLMVSLGSRNLRASESPKGEPASMFGSKCAMCHGPDGRGNTTIGKAIRVVNLRSPEVQKETDAKLAAVISGGKQKMPAFGNSLSKAQVNELIAFIRGLAKKK